MSADPRRVASPSGTGGGEVKCPECGRIVGTYASQAGERVQVHREPKPEYSRYPAPWCVGGGVRV